MKNKPYELYKVPHLKSMKEHIEYCAKEFSDKPAIRYFDDKEFKEASFKQFKSDIDAFGMYLVSKGFENAKIALIGHNSYEWIVSYFAVVNYGNVIVPVDRLLGNEDIKDILDRSEASAVVHTKSFEEVVTKQENTVSLKIEEFTKYLEEGRKVIAEGKIKAPEIDIDKLCTIIYTSGTTGKPKGVMLTHKSIMADSVATCEFDFLSGGNITMLPLHHTFAFTACVVCAHLWGVPIFINRSLKKLMEDINIAKPQHILAVPMMVEVIYKKIWDNAKKSGKDKALKLLIKVNKALMAAGIDIRHILFKQIRDSFGGNLDMIVSGGAPIEDRYVQGMVDLGFTFINGYGISECSPIVAVNRLEYWRMGSVGPAIPCNEVKIIDGEICVKGDNVMLGYYDDKESTMNAFTEDGWFKTGDLGRVDKDGFLYITGRIKNLIILANGKNVSPEELESKILSVPNVIETVVYEKDGMICAEIYAEDKEGIEVNIKELNRDLPMYKKIQKVIFRDTEFEKTTTKKIIRSKIAH